MDHLVSQALAAYRRLYASGRSVACLSVCRLELWHFRMHFSTSRPPVEEENEWRRGVAAWALSVRPNTVTIKLHFGAWEDSTEIHH